MLSRWERAQRHITLQGVMFRSTTSKTSEEIGGDQRRAALDHTLRWVTRYGATTGSEDAGIGGGNVNGDHRHAVLGHTLRRSVTHCGAWRGCDQWWGTDAMPCRTRAQEPCCSVTRPTPGHTSIPQSHHGPSHGYRWSVCAQESRVDATRHVDTGWSGGEIGPRRYQRIGGEVLGQRSITWCGARSRCERW